MLQAVDLAKVRRGAVLLVDLDPTVGHEIQKQRPCVVVSPDLYNKSLRTIIVIPITGDEPGKAVFAHEVALAAGGSGGLDKNSKAQPHQMRCVDKSRIVKVLGRLSVEEMLRVQQSAQMAIAEIPTDR